MRTCIFCSSSPVTAEHVWPSWLVDRFPRTKIRVRRWTASEILDYPAISIVTRVRAVCATCNNGWMSELENSAKPVLVPLVDGERMTLAADQQTIAAIWAVKTSMVFEHTLGPSAAYWTPDERSRFADTPYLIPGETLVRIAGYAGTQLAYFFGGATQLSSSAGPLAQGFRATLVVGRLVLQVESDRWKETTGRMGLWWPPTHAARSEWIFPVQHHEVRAPPGEPLDDQAIRDFARGASTGRV